MIFDVVTLTSKVDLLYKKNRVGQMTFESEGLFNVATFLHMVAAGELCCLSDNSGSLVSERLRYCNFVHWQNFTSGNYTKIPSISF